MNWEINHRAVCRYSAPISQSHHLLHLKPRPHPRQELISYNLSIAPMPASRADFVDDFGNPTSIVAIETEHARLEIHSRAQVHLMDDEHPDHARLSSWNDVAAQLRANLGPETFEAVQYSCPSRYIQPTRDIYKYVRRSFPDGRPISEAVLELTARIHRDFAVERGAADMAASAESVLKSKRGSAQDLAHLETACLRTLGLAARCVSGYLVTGALSGSLNLAGTDACHAWISVWAPETGWFDVDPARNIIQGKDYIAIGFGRDFHDVSAVSGVLLGGGEYRADMAVEVRPLEEPAGKPD